MYGIILPCLKLLLICQTDDELTLGVTRVKIWNTLKVRNIPHSSMFHRSVLFYVKD